MCQITQIITIIYNLYGAAHIFQCYQQYCSAGCWAWISPQSGVTMLNNIVDNIEMWEAQHCSTLFSSTMNRLCIFTRAILWGIAQFVAAHATSCYLFKRCLLNDVTGNM